MALLKGQTFTLVEKKGTEKVEWKQGSFVGFGGDRSQVYNLCEYKTCSGEPVLVYIQGDYSIPKELTVDTKLQYGMQNGVLFYVFHDKSQLPYQNRFVKNPSQEFLAFLNDVLKSKTSVDLSWAAGDYLRNIE